MTVFCITPPKIILAIFSTCGCMQSAQKNPFLWKGSMITVDNSNKVVYKLKVILWININVT